MLSVIHPVFEITHTNLKIPNHNIYVSLESPVIEQANRKLKQQKYLKERRNWRNTNTCYNRRRGHGTHVPLQNPILAAFPHTHSNLAFSPFSAFTINFNPNFSN